MGRKTMKSMHLIHKHDPLFLDLGSDWASEQMNERRGGKRAVWNKKLVSSTSKQASGRANGPALYALISCNFYLEYSGGGLAVVVAVAMASHYSLSQKYITIFSNTILEKKSLGPMCLCTHWPRKYYQRSQNWIYISSKLFEVRVTASVGLSIG